MAKVPNAVEILPKVSTARVGCTSVTDRQTTDGRAIAYSEREREFTFTKNRITFTTPLSYSWIIGVRGDKRKNGRENLKETTT